MITYLYWSVVIAFAATVFYLLGRKNRWKAGAIALCIILFTGWAANFFFLEQIFVKRYGGVMSIGIPDGQFHITATWKDDNLWVENYDPATNTCYFNEYSRGNLLQGKVIIKNCNPLRPGISTAP